jgi:hypothetical protein
LRPYSPGGALNAFVAAASPCRPATRCPPFRARTTGVSNPVRSPGFRASASERAQRAAFATGVPLDLNTFHRSTQRSARPYPPRGRQYPGPFSRWAGGFHPGLDGPPTRPLSPVIPNNVRSVRLTAAAGTNLARAYCTSVRVPRCFRALQPEGLRRARGVARSGLRPLPKILDCSHP